MRKHHGAYALLSFSLIVVLAGCSTPGLSALDRSTIKQLEDVAFTGADVMQSGDFVTKTDCWTPTEHIVDYAVSRSVFRVICRVHYVAESVSRYQDVVCIGDLQLTPALDHCFHWAPYTNMASFEDGDRLASPSPDLSK